MKQYKYSITIFLSALLFLYSTNIFSQVTGDEDKEMFNNGKNPRPETN